MKRKEKSELKISEARLTISFNFRLRHPFQIQSNPEITLMAPQPFSLPQTWLQLQKSLLKDLRLGILVSEL